MTLTESDLKAKSGTSHLKILEYSHGRYNQGSYGIIFLLFSLFTCSFFSLFIFIIYFFETTDRSTFVREGHWEMNILWGWHYRPSLIVDFTVNDSR